MGNAPSRYRIAAVGLGPMGLTHVEAIAACDRLDLVAVCDLQPARRKEALAIAPNARETDDFNALLADPTLDAVSINTLSDIRPALISAALAAGKHIAAEKPLAPTAAAAAAVADEAARSGRICTVNLFNRNAPYLRRAQQWIRQGMIGQVGVIRIDHLTPGLPVEQRKTSHFAVEGHVLHDCGMHYVDVIHWFAGARVTDFSARAVRFWGQDRECHFIVQGHCANGVLFDLNNGFVYNTLAQDCINQSMVELIGTRGTIRLTHDFQTVQVRLRGPSDTIDEVFPYGNKKLDIYYREFAEAMETGNGSKLPKLQDAVVASEVAQQMVEKAISRPLPDFGSATDLHRV